MPFRVGRWDRLTSQFASTYLRPGVARSAAPRSSKAQESNRHHHQPHPPPPPHNLVLYDFEASPWCRLVREHATILDLTLSIRPCPRQTLFGGEGSFGPDSRFRKEAMGWYRRRQEQPQQQQQSSLTQAEQRVKNLETTDDDRLTFPLLVDHTATAPPPTTTNTSNTNTNTNNNTITQNQNGTIILNESHDILSHLWNHYGDSVLPTPSNNPRPDQIANSPSRSFPTRFLSLAGPSYLRPWPRCGLMRFPHSSSSWGGNATEVVLYQAEGCPESRLVREVLCCLEIPYRSVPVGEGSSNSLPSRMSDDTAGGDDDGAAVEIPVLEVVLRRESNDDGTETETETDGVQTGKGTTVQQLIGARRCVDYLQNIYSSSSSRSSFRPNNEPGWFDPLPRENLGRSGGPNFSVITAAVAAVRKGNEAFVPDRAME